MKRLPWSCLSLIVLVVFYAAPLPAASLPGDDGVRVVASLYRDFAWELLTNEPLGGEPGFIDQPQSVLERYLAPSLAAAIVEDRACVERTGEACRMDFMPLWNSQDPSPSDLKVRVGAKKSEVLVEFWPSPADEETVTFRFIMVGTDAGPRVRDIVYDEEWSLRKALALD